MKLPDPPSLTPEERDLARRLAPSGPPREPSPALDARILAAARVAATSAPPVATRARPFPRRWPVALGLAASLVLAVGIAWRLRPLPDTRMDFPSDAPAAPAVRSMVTPAPVAATRQAEPPAAANSNVADAAPAAEAQAPAPEHRTAGQIERREIARAPSEPAIVFEVPAQQAAKTAAPSPATPSDDVTPQAFGSTAPVERAAAAPASPPSHAAQAQSATNEAARAAMVGAAADSALQDEPPGDVPPATADSPAVRDAWLQRIRGLVDDGDVAAARASLQEFVRRYPTFALPEDLRALER